MALADLVKNRAKKGILVPVLEEHLMLSQTSEDRRDKMFHPSDLAGKFCPRAWALYNYHPEGLSVKEGAIAPKLARIFGNGHGVHKRMQGYFAAMGNLYGTWDRRKEDGTVELSVGFTPPGEGWAYLEVGLRDRDYRIVGSTDGLLKLGDKKLGLEVKSINENGFKWMGDEEAKEVHKNQTLIYMHCLEVARWETIRAGVATVDFLVKPLEGFVLLYENKNTQELKEFFVPFIAAEVEAYMKSRKKLMYEALEYERTGTWPDCRCVIGKETALCQKFDSL